MEVTVGECGTRTMGERSKAVGVRGMLKPISISTLDGYIRHNLERDENQELRGRTSRKRIGLPNF
jgi:hypothetical protein